MGDKNKTYKGTCSCGAVEVTVAGDTDIMGFCHCSSCRGWQGAPVTALSLWTFDDVKVTKGEEHLGVYMKTKDSQRKFCKLCGGHVMTAHPSGAAKGLIDVYAAAIVPDFPFQPKLHIHYQEKVFSIRDGLPKFKDLPAEYGGSGEMLPE